MSRKPGAGKREPVGAALQAYADRGVFRGFRATALPRGRVEYSFVWLSRRPVAAVHDSRSRTLTFPAVFPHADAHVASDVRALVSARSTRQLPSHKRIDGRRARVTISNREGHLTLRVAVRGANEDYAVRAALNLINDLFVALHEHHPDYLVRQFGFSGE